LCEDFVVYLLIVRTAHASKAKLKLMPTKKMLSAMGEFQSQTFIDPSLPTAC
jgi:hypothetical protein